MLSKNICTFLAILVILLGSCDTALSQDEAETSSDPKTETALIGKKSTFECSVQSQDAADVEIWWKFQGANITNSDQYKVSVTKTASGAVSSELALSIVDWKDAGLYTCLAREVGVEEDVEPTMQNIDLKVFASPRSLDTKNGQNKVELALEMSCTFMGKPHPAIKWLRFGTPVSEDPLKYEISVEERSETEVISYLKIMNLGHEDNGTYLCHGENEFGSNVAVIDAIVFDKPSVKIDFVTPAGQDKIFFNWTVIDWNAPVSDYFLSFREAGQSAWVYHQGEKIPSDAKHFVMRNLRANTTYLIKLAAKNEYGMGDADTYYTEVRTLDFDPVFIPEVSVKGLTWNSISIGWTTPEEEKIKQNIHYYKLTRRTVDTELNMYHPSNKYSFYLWRNLSPATDYTFTVAACNKFTRECSKASEIVDGTTEDGLAGPPALVRVLCRNDNVSGMNFVEVEWQEPKKKYGEIEFYNIQLQGVASYFDTTGHLATDNWGPELKTQDADSTVHKTKFDFLMPNTNYTARVCAVTRRKECGEMKAESCVMRSTPPVPEQMSNFVWSNMNGNGHDYFKLQMPRVSERNGPICCLRVIVVKMKPGQTEEDLPHQSELEIKTYRSVHSSRDAWGAYIAEILGANFLGSEIFIGDGQNKLAANLGQCPACQSGVRAQLLQAVERAEQRRFTRYSIPESESELVEDGFMDPDFNYTAFVQVVVDNPFGLPRETIGQSPFMPPRKPGELLFSAGSSPRDVNTVLVAILGILAGLILVTFFLLLSLFFLKRYSKQVAATQGGVEMGLRRSIRHLCSTIRGRDHSQYLITPDSPIEIKPIAKDELVQAYLERHKDSDMGFQAEFEMLPDRFPDRTTEANDSSFNRPKNRYPDIKAYDQTRVKLSQVSDEEGCDYINANFVYGYKERKKWICAQGPLDHTVADFWRMIYEQGVEIIIMLTNLEEYNRIKCAQYWPQAGDSNYGFNPVINIAFCTEKRYSDYIVRELQLSVNKGDNEKETRRVYHYHYLQWKDFNAPEHAPGMLRFAKRINEASKDGHPLLVHCSAGVGRSGTLIAIDALLEQLKEEGQVSVYQLVCDLRHYRNYLVQSVKQYVFVYRAIMEWAQFGDTELEATNIKSTWLSLSSDTEKLQAEFSRLAQIVDDRKALSVGTNEENKAKNQTPAVIPFDRNRVILTPDGLKPHSTYINASFIEGYHNDESFIITQDPLPETAEDFWRMITEHNIQTMVMLSGDDGWQYWGDGEKSFGGLKVTLMNTEKLPAYYKRDFKVHNTKVDEEVNLTHFMYSDWKGREGDVPSSTHGLLDLVEHAMAYKIEANLSGPIAVHCKYGSERSSVYVALSCLVQQIKNESRADVFTTVRKLRTQRQGMLQHLSLYQFVYRAISDYVDLYRNKDEEYEYSVPVNSVNQPNHKVNGSLKKK